MDDVTVRNCRVDGWLNNIALARDGVQSLARGHEYDHHLSGVTVEDSTLTNSQGVGLYVNAYVTNTTIQRDTILRSGSTGIYLDEGSRGALVSDNTIAGNGYVENGPGGTNTTFGNLDVRFWGPGREGIAVDGAYDNRITDNALVFNSAGGVFLYTNCGEYVHSQPASWLDHRFAAEHNVVAANTIIGTLGTGVWVASRMGENVYPMDCSDTPYVSGPLLAITRDRAAHNSITDNTVWGENFGIRVEDDNTAVLRNHIIGTAPSQFAVIVGTPYRTSALDLPVNHTIVRSNVATIVNNPSPYRWVDGVADLRAGNNTANGRQRSFCPAPDVPRGPFVMVYAFAPQNPDDPPQPPPAYSVPSLGVLPLCR
ncbi:MAG TPA: right-handed parallel beta-helix repeat-containing protein [Acidimicrobiia bacterium]